MFMYMDNFVFSLFAMQLDILQNRIWIKFNALLPLFKALIKILCESYGKFHIFLIALFHAVSEACGVNGAAGGKLSVNIRVMEVK